MIDAEDLLWRSARSPTEETLLDSGRPRGVGKDGLVIDARLVQRRAEQFGLGVVSHHSGQRHPCLQASGEEGQAGRPAQAHFLASGVEHQDRGLGTNPIRVAVGIAIEHQVAQHEESGFSPAVTCVVRVHSFVRERTT